MLEYKLSIISNVDFRGAKIYIALRCFIDFSCTFRCRCSEPYQKTVTKLRPSNHKLAIETGRYSRPFKKPAERTCPICKIEMEDEYHFLNICPAYQEKRSSLLDYLENEYRIKMSRMSPNRIFMFLINPPSGNGRIQKLIAKHIFECFEKRKGEDGKVNTQGLLSL